MTQASGGTGAALDAQVGTGAAEEVDEKTVTAAELDDARRHAAAVDRKVTKLQGHLAGAQSAASAAAERVDAAEAAHKRSAGRQ